MDKGPGALKAEAMAAKLADMDEPEAEPRASASVADAPLEGVPLPLLIAAVVLSD